MDQSTTKPGTRKLSDVARHVVHPDGIVSTGYPAVQAKCRDMGIVHDDWQQGLGRLVLGKRLDGKYAATVGGVVMSIPRQVGKTFTVGSLIFALCIIFPRLTVLWTAHHTRTSDETFDSMYALSMRKKVAPHISARRRANGQQAIRFQNGSRIMFGAREQGFGRGFAEVDIEVFDEAQILNESATEDMVAATNQAKHPAGALLFYMGTPPRPKDPGEVFRGKRAKALAGKSRDMVYVELSADLDADPDDRRQWAKANPSFPVRTPLESMQRLRENVGSDESFLREGLGVWDEVDASRVINPATWAALVDPEPTKPLRPVFGLALSKDQTAAAISVVGVGRDGLPLLAPVEERPGTNWVVDRLVALCKAADAPVALDKGGPAGSLLRDLHDQRVRTVELTQGDYAQACGALLNDVNGKALRHVDDPGLNEAVRTAKTRPLGDRWAWARGSAEIVSLEAATVALHGFRTRPSGQLWGFFG